MSARSPGPTPHEDAACFAYSRSTRSRSTFTPAANPVSTPTFAAFAKDRQPGEHYGDFVVRTGVVPEVKEGRFFND